MIKPVEYLFVSLMGVFAAIVKYILSILQFVLISHPDFLHVYLNMLIIRKLFVDLRLDCLQMRRREISLRESSLKSERTVVQQNVLSFLLVALILIIFFQLSI